MHAYEIDQLAALNFSRYFVNIFRKPVLFHSIQRVSAFNLYAAGGIKRRNPPSEWFPPKQKNLRSLLKRKFSLTRGRMLISGFCTA